MAIFLAGPWRIACEQGTYAAHWQQAAPEDPLQFQGEESLRN
jgi:hypothetical protein